MGGLSFAHLLGLPLPYSNWEWTTVSHSESMATIKRGVKAAIFRLSGAALSLQACVPKSVGSQCSWTGWNAINSDWRVSTSTSSSSARW